MKSDFYLKTSKTVIYHIPYFSEQKFSHFKVMRFYADVFLYFLGTGFHYSIV